MKSNNIFIIMPSEVTLSTAGGKAAAASGRNHEHPTKQRAVCE